MIGKQLGGRYEILERIGGGGMALVYKGHDLLLHRKVAVKVLRQQYVNDEEFISRFRREAQAAASLSHPNVVSIYDVGQEGEVHYIVMEYIEGTTLNDLIKLRAPLQVEEAVRIAAQICDALDHAHHNQIIHRDIKPHNILMGKNGRVKVTDFGIARAATSSTITQTGSVVGSVHYFSPEHAKGTTAGEVSDLYSLGIVLYQMLTGTLPFLGESPISVALKHLQEDVEEPRKINSLIPQSVENVILKAMRKNADERYQSAAEMQKDLETCLQPERLHEPKIAFHDDGMDEERTRIVPAIKPTVYKDLQETGQHPITNADTPAKKRSPWVRPTVWLGILAALIVILAGLAFYMNKLVRVPEVSVPLVENRNVEDAKQILTNAQLNYEIVQDFSKTVPADVVIKQSVPANMNEKVHTVITLTVSKGVEKQKMINAVGEKLATVQDNLVAQGSKKEQISVEEVFSKDQPPGVVTKQIPAANEEYDPTSASIKLSVSKGKETFKMPNLVGMTQNAASDKIKELGLTLAADVQNEPSYKIPKGSVVRQFPFNENDGVSPGDQVRLFVSSGLPDEAGQMIVNVPVHPSAPGKATNIKLIVTDAQYDAFEYKSTTVSKDDAVDVRIVVAPDKNATIQVKQDDKVVEVITKTYQDYLAQKGTKRNSTTSPTGASPDTGAAGSGAGAAGTGTGTGGAGAVTPGTGASAGNGDGSKPANGQDKKENKDKQGKQGTGGAN